MKKNLFNRIIPYFFAISIIIVSIISYNRFIINNDYFVGYEGVCDPNIEKCFIGCEDDECTEEYYYSQIVKYAPDLYSECGEDITDCKEANVCLPSDRNCSITYCDIETDGDSCSTYIEKSNVETEDQLNIVE